MQHQTETTRLLRAWRCGDNKARDKLLNLTYEQMRRIATDLLRGDGQRFELYPTELVNECALRLFGINEIDWRDRAHFIAIATTMMRRVVVDSARRRNAAKRARYDVTLSTASLGVTPDMDLHDLDQALERLAEVSLDIAKVVEYKFFGGLTNPEVAEVMNTSESTVKRHWSFARAWLFTELTR